jgi:metallophosphoesterase superfamily enzyme
MLFKKAISFTDIHFGRTGNSPQANLDNLEFIDWAIEQGKTWGAETMIFCGDYFDNRHSVAVSTLHYGLRGMEKLNEAFNVIWLPGNHDLFYRDKRDLSSVEFAKLLPNIKVITEPTVMDDVLLLPWLVGDEHKKLPNIKTRYAFGHLEMGGFMMNAKVVMPETGHSVTHSSFVNQEYVFSGHFHIRQQKKNVVYIGNTFPFNYSDAWDQDRGIMMLEWGKDPIFKAWDEQPLFRTMRLSDMINKPNEMLKQKMSARVAIDFDITYEESQVIKEEFIKNYGLRKLELVPQAVSVEAAEFEENVDYQSIDQIVIEGLNSITSKDIQSQKLIAIYNTLKNM